MKLTLFILNLNVYIKVIKEIILDTLFYKIPSEYTGWDFQCQGYIVKDFNCVYYETNTAF